jgi:hypothetical protein
MNGADTARADTKQEAWGNDPLGRIGTHLLGTYLLVLPCAALAALWWLFPTGRAADKELIVLALLGGALGSYMHVAQSFAAYVGNRQACASWVWWYLLRTPIGACLGVLMYIVVRAGLLAGGDAPSPYGVLAFASLAGWFSKQATDKLAEVFDTLFKSEKKEHLKDQLRAGAKPTIELATELPSGEVLVMGAGFLPGAGVRMNGQALRTTFVSPNELKAMVPPELRTGTRKIVIVNPAPDAPPSDPKELEGEAS